MKFSTIIGSIGVAMLGIVAAGCSAETAESGENGEPSVGSSTLPLASIGSARYEFVGCAYSDYIIVAGGFNGASPSDDAFFMDLTANPPVWTALTDDLTTARVRHKAVLIGDECHFVGGDDGTNAIQSSQIFDFSLYIANSNPDSVGRGWRSEDTMQAARTRGAGVSQCGTSKLIALGGNTKADGSGTKLDTVEVWSAGAWATLDINGATAGNGTLPGGGRYDASLGVSNSYTEFLFGGGETAGGKAQTIDLLAVDSSCVPLAAMVKADRDSSGATNFNVLSTARANPVSFPEGTTDTFLIAGGREAAADSAVVDKVVVDDWATGDVTLQTSPGAMSVAREEPILVKISSAKYAVIGGKTGGSNPDTSPTASLQVWNTVSNEWSTAVSLGTARHAFAGMYSPALESVVVTGGYGSGGALTSTELLP